MSTAELGYPYHSVILKFSRDIVKASHLSPLDRKDIVDSKRNQPWNSVAHGSSTLEENHAAEDATPPSIGAGIVSNVQDFTRQWRRLSREPKPQQYQ